MRTGKVGEGARRQNTQSDSVTKQSAEIQGSQEGKEMGFQTTPQCDARPFGLSAEEMNHIEI